MESSQLNLDRELVDLGRGMAGALVDAHDALAAGAGRQAEDLAGLRVEPRALEVDTLVALDREITLVGFLQLRGGNADEAAVDIHECRHGDPPVLCRPAGIDRSGGPLSTLAWRAPSVTWPMAPAARDLN